MVAEPLDDSRMSLVEHLTELRSRVIKCAIAVVIGLLLAFFLYPWIFDFLIAPYEDIANEENSLTGGQLLQTDPLEGFAIRMKLSVYGGIALAMPVMLWQLWRFVTPGPVRAREALRDPVRGLAPSCCSCSAPASPTARCRRR